MASHDRKTSLVPLTVSGPLAPLFNPQSVAIVGASNAEGKLGWTLMKNLKDTKYAGKVFPVNARKEETIWGYKAYQSISEIAEHIDMAVVSVPSKLCNKVAEECGKKGVKILTVIAAGFKEVGGEGVKMEEEMVKICQKYGMRLCGPNCLGVSTCANFTFSKISPKPGHIAMISQSGAMMTGILDWADAADVGFSSFISLGNKGDLDECDFIEALGEEPNTRVIIGYLESVKDGARFMKVCSEVSRKKPIIILKGGRSAFGKKAAASHTGALAGSDIAYDLAFAKCGVIRAYTINELFNYAAAFVEGKFPNGENFAIVTNAGGPGIITTDAFEAFGLGFAQFSKETEQALLKKLPEEANVHNPVDIVGDAAPERYTFALETLFALPDNQVAGAVVLATPQAQTQPDKLVEHIAAVAKKFPNKVMTAAFVGGATMLKPAQKLGKMGIPTFPFPEDAVKSLKGLDLYGRVKRQPIPTNDVESSAKPDKAVIKAIFDKVRAEKRPNLTPAECSAIFTQYGIKHPKTAVVTSADDAAKAAQAATFPVVCKIVSPDIIHKMDVGGVVLNLNSVDAVKKAYNDIMTSVKAKEPKAHILGIEVQKMLDTKNRKKMNEVILGCSRDPQWGPMLMFGQGGIYANYLKDVTFALATGLKKAEAIETIKKTKIYALLEGVRGEPRSDIDGLVDMLLRLAQFVVDFPDVQELDINPAFVFDNDVQAADIKINIGAPCGTPLAH